MDKFKSLTENNRYIILDGAMGTQLQQKGLKGGELPELLNIEAPQDIIAIHKSYIEAGADIIYTNTFGANRLKLEGSGYSVEEIISAGIKNAKKACEGTHCLTALDIGPTGTLMQGAGTLGFENAYNIFKEQVSAGRNADLIAIETMSDLSEARAAVLAAKENSDLPVICTMTFEENGRTFTGCSVSAAVLSLQGLGVDAIGINCSLGPDRMKPMIEEMVKYARIPVIVKPNAGLPDPQSNKYDLNAHDFACEMLKIADTGALIFGGCCGTAPEYIKELKNALCKRTPVRIQRDNITAVCSSTRTVEADGVKIIGERINPTGKRLFKQALINNDMDYIMRQAIEQAEAGADILDVNVGLPEIDEREMMIRVCSALQNVTDLPLQIDSSDPEVIEAALRIYNGRAIVNSVNGERKSLEKILPIVKKYGACVIGLTLDENGIPKTANERFEIAKRIISRAKDFGIDSRDILIDCLTLTASAEQEGVRETLNALSRVKRELCVHTVLGVSNISFGLPNRELVNSTFLTMAMENGLDFPIINPNNSAMTDAVAAFNMLNGHDKGAKNYIKAYGESNICEKPVQKQGDLFDAVKNGIKGEAKRLCAEMLLTESPMEIVNTQLIPALDEVGTGFEGGRLFLPQLISAAEAAQGAFEVIKEGLSKNGAEEISSGEIILATVKGDIHDIGKNIVKILLENYGYTVIDLGRDTPPELIVKTAVERNIKLIGLSALMTTTLKSMAQTINMLRESHVDCRIMVGGAVLTREYAKEIGADFYAKDAKESVDIAKKVFGN